MYTYSKGNHGTWFTLGFVHLWCIKKVCTPFLYLGSIANQLNHNDNVIDVVNVSEACAPKVQRRETTVQRSGEDEMVWRCTNLCNVGANLLHYITHEKNAHTEMHLVWRYLLEMQSTMRVHTPCKKETICAFLFCLNRIYQTLGSLLWFILYCFPCFVSPLHTRAHTFSLHSVLLCSPWV